MQSYNPGMQGRGFPRFFIALVVKDFKMSLRRHVVNVAVKNVIYFLLRFSPSARCINRF